MHHLLFFVVLIKRLRFYICNKWIIEKSIVILWKDKPVLEEAYENVFQDKNTLYSNQVNIIVVENPH